MYGYQGGMGGGVGVICVFLKNHSGGGAGGRGADPGSQA